MSGASVVRLVPVAVFIVLSTGCDSFYQVKGEVRRAVSVEDGRVRSEPVPGARVTAYFIDEEDVTGPVLDALPEDRTAAGVPRTAGPQGDFVICGRCDPFVGRCGMFRGPQPIAVVAELEGERSRPHVVWFHRWPGPTVEVMVHPEEEK